MKKFILIACALGVYASEAQLSKNDLIISKASSRSFAPPVQQHQQASVNINDTLLYFFSKHYYKNDTMGGANTQFYTFKQPYSGTLSIPQTGAVFLNTETITVNGLEGLVLKHPGSPSTNVPVKLYLYYVNANNLPISPPIDSVLTTVSSANGVWVGGNFSAPRTVTANFAVTFGPGAISTGDTIRTFINNAHTATATTAGVPKYGEGLGLMLINGNWQKTTNTFGTGTDYEFIVAPRVSFQFQAGVSTVSSTACNNSNVQFINTTNMQGILENRQFNFNKFAAFIKPTFEQLPPTDSIYNWTFTGAAPPASNAKNPTVFMNTAGLQTASLAVAYWYSTNAGYWNPPPMDGASTQITVSNQGAPMITVNGNTNICAGQSTTLTASGNTTFTWTTNPPINTASLVVNPTTMTTYTVSANNGGCTAVRVVTVQVVSPPNVQVTGPSSVCLNSQFVLTASGAQNYQWSNTSTAPSLTLSATTATVVSYTVTGTSGSCPQSVAVKDVTINPLPLVTLTTPCYKLCSKATGGQAIELLGAPVGGLYSGSGAAGSVVGNTFTPNNPGIIAVTYNFTDPATNCQNQANVTMTVQACNGGLSLCGVGINEEQRSAVQVYPNPVTGGILHVSNLESISSITVLNILGEIVKRENVQGGNHDLDLSTLPAGQYFLRLHEGNNVRQTLKVVNQN